METIDIELLNKYRALDLEPESGCYTNWLGLKTDASMFANSNAIEGKIFPDVPAGGDGVYGGYSEYAAFLTAIDNTPNRLSFTAVELGAGWGPWISGIGVVCKRLNFAQIDLIGVEADEEKCGLMSQHMRRNGLHAEIIHGAVWTQNTTLKFPKIHRQDHGAAASEQAASGERDYRGLPQQYVDVPAFSLETICQNKRLIDYMHWDIQGAELEVAMSAIALLNEKVRFLFIGTHSRLIEGSLIELFFREGWDLLHQNPCNFSYNLGIPTVVGMTTTDGELFLRNPKLGIA